MMKIIVRTVASKSWENVKEFCGSCVSCEKDTEVTAKLKFDFPKVDTIWKSSIGSLGIFSKWIVLETRIMLFI